MQGQQTGQYEEAAGQFEKALKKRLQDQDVYFMLGMCFVQLDNALLSIPYLMRSVELEPGDTEARFQYGLALAKSGEYKQAIDQLEKVVQQDPEHADAYYNLGVAYGSLYNDTEKALIFFEKAIDAQPDHQLAHYGKRMIQKLENDGK